MYRRGPPPLQRDCTPRIYIFFFVFTAIALPRCIIFVLPLAHIAYNTRVLYNIVRGVEYSATSKALNRPFFSLESLQKYIYMRLSSFEYVCALFSSSLENNSGSGANEAFNAWWWKKEKKNCERATRFPAYEGLHRHWSAETLNGRTIFFSFARPWERRSAEISEEISLGSRNAHACYYGITDIECPFGLSSSLRFSALFTLGSMHQPRERERALHSKSQNAVKGKSEEACTMPWRERAQTVRSSAHFRAASMHPRLAPNYPSLVVKPRETKRHVPFDAAVDSTDEPIFSLMLYTLLRISSVQLRDRPTSVSLSREYKKKNVLQWRFLSKVIHERFLQR